MQTLELLGAALALLGTLGLGMVAHELAHALVLSALGVPYDINWFPGRTSDPLDLGLLGALATVTPRRIPRGVPTWGLRLSAVAPLAVCCLAVVCYLVVRSR